MMDRLRQFRFKLRALTRGRRLEADMAEEMAAHLERSAAANGAAGMTEAEARASAMRRFGSLSSAQDLARDERRFRWLESVMRDLRYAARQLRRSLTFTMTAVLSLALGIGASAAIFSAVHAVLFRQLGLPDEDRLAVVRKGPVGTMPQRGVSPANALEIVEYARPFAGVAPFTLTQFVLRQDSHAERLGGMRVGSSFFQTLGVTPALGRDFVPSDDRAGAPRVAIISHALWRRSFNADPLILGQPVSIGSEPVPIIGVMPERFQFPELFGTSFKPDVWVPLAFSRNEAAARGAGYMSLLLKRHPHASWDSVQRELEGIARSYEKLEPTTYSNQQLRAIPLHEQVVAETRPMLLLLWAAVTCVLAIACANAANVVLSRTVARTRELAVRSSLGASRLRLLSQLLVESLFLSVLAAALGLLLAVALLAAARDTLTQFLPRVDEIAVNWQVLTFTMVTTSVTSLAVGLWPAYRVSAVTPRDAVSQAGARGSTEGRWAARFRMMLLVGQIAVAVILGTTAALLGRSFAAVLRADLGFRAETLLTFDLSVPDDTVPASDVFRVYERLTEQLESRPGIQAVGALSVLPLAGGDFGWGFQVADKPVPPGTVLPYADVRIVTPGTLEALGVAIRRGRSFERGDRRDGQLVAIVNETFARRIWPGEDPIGKQVKLGGPANPWMTVVGIAADVRFKSPDQEPPPAIYRPQTQHSWRDMAVVVRPSGSTADVVSAVREEVGRLGGGVALLRVHEFAYFLSHSVAERRLVTSLVTVFAGLALTLAVVGVYGLFAYAVVSRTREIGLRIALGASTARIIWITMRQGLLLGGLGVAVGTAGTFAGQRLIETQLYEVRPTDPATFSSIAVTVLATALLASYLPARRAAGIDPTTALRVE